MKFWGFDLGDGESALAVAESVGWDTPKIADIDGHPVTLTVWALMPDGEVRIGEKAAKSAMSSLRSAARFKSRFLNPQVDAGGLIRDFSSKILEHLRKTGQLSGDPSEYRFYIGCPAGWSDAARMRYLDIFGNIACPSPHVVSESRAVMVGAVQSNSLRDFTDIRTHSVLVVDIGSSTTDFAFIQKGSESRIYTGGEVALGGGIMDELLLDACVEACANPEEVRKVFSQSEPWRVECELRARKLKEQYYSASEDELHDTLMITYEEPVLFDLVMNPTVSDLLIQKPCAQLNGLSFAEAFQNSLVDVKKAVQDSLPELIFLTGGVSRMPQVKRWCQEVFPDAAIFADREPEFSVARGLAWCGRIDEELKNFRLEVDELIASDTVEQIVLQRLTELYRNLLDSLLDPLLEEAIKPSLLAWRNGELRRLADLERVLPEKIRLYLYSENAKKDLYVPVRNWLDRVSEDLGAVTSSICRKYHVPEHALEITASLTPGDLGVLDRLETSDVFAGQPLTGAAIFVESVISVLVGLMCGGGGMALISSGPLGVVAGIVISAVILGLGTVLGKKSIDEKLMNADLPHLVRRMALAGPLPGFSHGLFSLPNPLKVFSQNKNNSENDAISERRMKNIRQNIRTSYEKILEDPNNEDFKNVNEKMCREISDQIEHLLKELSEQVEIPL